MTRQAFRSRAGNTNGAHTSPSNLHLGRIRVVYWGILLALGVIAAHLVNLHLNPSKKLSKEDLSHMGTVYIHIPRGNILSSQGRLLATDRRVPLLAADPSSIRDSDEVARWLSVRIGLSETEILGHLTKVDSEGRTRKFSVLKRELSEEEIQNLGDSKELARIGLTVDYELTRFYPQGQLAAHVLGFVGRDGAAEGVEKSFDTYLKSQCGERKSTVDSNRLMLMSLTSEYRAPRGGDNVHLTIDDTIQYSLETELDKALVSSQAIGATGLVMDPNTGAILAMASRPAFDPNDPGKGDAVDRWNHALLGSFEPGSSFKIVAASAAIERGLITPETRINCENGSFNPYGHRIKDFHPLGTEPFTRCFSDSSNIAIIKVGAMLGKEQMAEWIARFGFGRRTCPDFAREGAGVVWPMSKWSRLSMGSLPMGQELRVTVLQLARAFGAIANGGYLVEPYIVERAVSPEGEITYVHEAATPTRILSEKTAQTMRELAYLVVAHGTGKPASIPEYRVGGKTGTAQVAKSEYGQGFCPGKFTAIFAGFAPVAAPKLCAVIVVQEPGIKLHYGGTVCGPVFKAVVRDALIRMQCPRDPEDGHAVPPQYEMLVSDVEASAEQETDDPDTVVARATPEFGATGDDAPLESLDGLELVSLDAVPRAGEACLPNFMGMTKGQARAKVAVLGLNWDTQGSGWVVSQDPAPGTPIREVSVCRLVFSNSKPGEDPHDPRSTAKTARL